MVLWCWEIEVRKTPYWSLVSSIEAYFICDDVDKDQGEPIRQEQIKM